MNDTTDMPEKLGRYEVVQILGRGAMGVVYEGRDPNIGRRVAIKTCRKDLLDSGRADEMLKRFLREAQAAGNLQHPSIITIYDADEQDGLAYIAMEYVEGTDLQKQIKAKKTFSVGDAVKLCATVCEALDHAHERGVVHRDIKPSNILLRNNGAVCIADFGIAHLDESTMTAEGQMIGTPHYMSPEQVRGREVDGRADLFSVGIILYELLTGEKPFPGEQLQTVMHGITQVKPPQPKALDPTIDPVINAVVMKALGKNPKERYQSGDEMAAALREALKDEPDPAVTKVRPPASAEQEATVVSQDLPETVAAGAPTVASVSPVPETEQRAARRQEMIIDGEATAASATPHGQPQQPRPRAVRKLQIGVGVVLAVVAISIAAIMAPGTDSAPAASNDPTVATNGAEPTSTANANAEGASGATTYTLRYTFVLTDENAALDQSLYLKTFTIVVNDPALDGEQRIEAEYPDGTIQFSAASKNIELSVLSDGQRIGEAGLELNPNQPEIQEEYPIYITAPMGS